MSATIPETNKKPGVCYAITDDGIELPVVDVTHPAFAFDVSDAELSGLIDQLVTGIQRQAQLPESVRQSLAQNSILVRGMFESAGTFTTGMMTYLNKLGPDNLGDGYASLLDRQWAAGLTPLTFRWRMRDLARLLADGLARALAARPGAPVHLLNIGGGPAMDSLNALIVLRKEHPEILDGRRIRIHVLDIDSEGPSFGSRALESLLAEGAPLHGLAAGFEYARYDWADPSALRGVIDGFEAGAVAVGSSEGGLFEYASDCEIVDNLRTLRAGTPADFVMAGPVIRDASTLDPRLKITEHVEGRPAVRYIGLDAFGRLAGQAGWAIERHLDGPMHQVVSLRKT